MAKFTSGPWRIQRNGLGQSIGVTDAEHHPIDMSCSGPFEAQPCTSPNARLVAAAPEMYELLRDLRDNILEIENPAHYQNSPHQRVCALIEKIDGLAPSQAIGALLARIDEGGEND